MLSRESKKTQGINSGPGNRKIQGPGTKNGPVNPVNQKIKELRAMEFRANPETKFRESKKVRKIYSGQGIIKRKRETGKTVGKEENRAITRCHLYNPLAVRACQCQQLWVPM